MKIRTWAVPLSAAAAGLCLPAVLLLGETASAAPAHVVPAQCASSSILETWFAPEGDGFAGGVGYVAEFSNIGHATCTVQGWPVLKLTRNGHQIGLRARNNGSSAPLVTLKVGQTAHAVFTITDASNICTPVATNAITISQPAEPQETSPVSFRLPSAACPHVATIHTNPIRPGIGIPRFTTS